MKNRPVNNINKDKKIFRRTATKTNTRNLTKTSPRGGVRL